MSKERLIYFDVGAWTGTETSPPTMTFGLIERRAIALCCYNLSSNYDRKILPCDLKPPKENKQVVGSLSGLLNSQLKPSTGSFQFAKSLINEFLTILIKNKYELSPEQVKVHSTPEEKINHIINLIPVDEDLCLEGELFVLIPDLHIHYFKGSPLDNFITKYQDVLGKDDLPEQQKLTKAVSLEKDFGTFLATIREFQNQDPLQKKKLTPIFLGDTTEFWETKAMLKFYSNCNNVEEIIEQDKKLLEILKEFPIKGLAIIKDIPPDFIFFVSQILTKLASEVEKYEKLWNNNGAKDGETPRNKFISAILNTDRKMDLKDVLSLSDKILENYKYKDQDYLEILAEIFGHSYYYRSYLFPYCLYLIPGNHDFWPRNHGLDIFKMSSFNSTYNLFKLKRNHKNLKLFGLIKESPIGLQSFNLEGKAFFWIHHGNLDAFNFHYDCLMGYIITFLCAFFESYSLGDEFKMLESELIPDCTARKEAIDQMLSIVLANKDTVPAGQYPIKIMIVAHSHKPLLIDVTQIYQRRELLLKNKYQNDKNIVSKTISSLKEMIIVTFKYHFFMIIIDKFDFFEIFDTEDLDAYSSFLNELKRKYYEAKNWIKNAPSKISSLFRNLFNTMSKWFD